MPPPPPDRQRMTPSARFWSAWEEADCNYLALNTLNTDVLNTDVLQLQEADASFLTTPQALTKQIV